MRLVFMGTPEFSVTALEALYGAGHDIVAVYTQAPKPAGRGLHLTPSPVHQKADMLKIPIETPKSLRKSDIQSTLKGYSPDVIVVVAYGLILPQEILDIPPLGCFNIHASLLPRWRGAAPIQRAIMAGDTETGVTIMHMDAGLDTGAMALIERLDITPSTTAQSLHHDLAQMGASLVKEALVQKQAGILPCLPQPSEGITYAEKIQKTETHIDWTRSAFDVLRHIHGLSPFPGAWFEREGERIKILSASFHPDHQEEAGTLLDDHLLIACGQGAIRIESLQRAGKQKMSATEALKGWSVPARTKIGSA